MSLKPANHDDYRAAIECLVKHFQYNDFHPEIQKAVYWAMYALFHPDFAGEVKCISHPTKFFREVSWHWGIDGVVFPYNNTKDAFPYKFKLKIDKNTAMGQLGPHIGKWKGINVIVETKGMAFITSAELTEDLDG